MNPDTNLFALLAAADMDLRAFGHRYSEAAWLKWRRSRLADVANPDVALIGGPMDLVARGIMTLEGADGQTITLGPLSRVKYGELSRAEHVRLGIDHLYDPEDGDMPAKLAKADVTHQELVDTFAENVRNDPKHLMNNFLAVSTSADILMSFVFDATTTVGEAITRIKAILSGDDPALAKMLTACSRSSWIGRACMDGSWAENAEFAWHHSLGKNSAEIDAWVVKPMLVEFLDDLETGAFKNTAS